MKHLAPPSLPLQDGVRLEAPRWASWGNPAAVARRVGRRVSLGTILLLAFGLQALVIWVFLAEHPKLLG